MQEGRGGFDGRRALERLVARYPVLKSDEAVASVLAHEGGRGIEDSGFIEVAQELLLLRSQVGVAAVGCFRPLLPRLLDGVVQSLRQLRRHGIGRSGQQGDDTRRLRGEWTLDLHEDASILFSRILELAPYLLSSFLEYFAFAPPPFERLLLQGCASDASGWAPLSPAVIGFLDVLWASYRFLKLEPKVFRDLWDWSPVFDLLKYRPLEKDETSLDVRWCAVQIVSLVLQMSELATRAMSSSVSNLSDAEAFACHLRWDSVSQNVAVEKAGMYLEPTCVVKSSNLEVMELEGGNSFSSEQRHFEGNRCSHVEICGIELPVRHGVQYGRFVSSRRKSLVLTPTVKKNVEAVVLALSQCHPVLLEGPIGAGKSSLIQELANITGNVDLLFIHLDDQMDSKTLLGNYACTEVPGEFKWQPGALTQAVVHGLWVVFEDIDRAPFEIFSALIPLLEDRKLYIPGRGEMIHAADNFQLFSTVTRTKFGSLHTASGGRKDMLSNLWRKVVVDAPSDEELSIIMQASFPSLATVIPRMIDTLNLMRYISSQATPEDPELCKVTVYIGRQFSTRDLFKWCMRVADVQPLTNFRICVEAADCFAASIPSASDREHVLKAIARCWNLPFEDLKFSATLNKPSFQMSQSALQVGRALLVVHPRKGRSRATQIFASTGHAMRTLEVISVCVQQQEPVLLVGETGTGKTSLVQHLARQLGMPLTVLNMSQQTDSTDFLGGFKPVEAQSVCIPLFQTFNQLFKDTFSKKKNAKLLERVQRAAEKKKWGWLLKAFQMALVTVSELMGPAPAANRVLLKGSPPSDMAAQEDIEDGKEQSPKRKRISNSGLRDRWCAFAVDVQKAERQVEAAKTGFAFSFVEGMLVKALREGHWILLDEVNLAPVETLERLTGMLEGEGGSLCLTERGDVENVARHPNFRIFGAMNPATDFGKCDLPISLRNRFTEIYVDELTQREDLHALVFQYLEGALPSPPVEDIVEFYLQARQEAETQLLDGANQKPQYSLRSLARALEYTCAALPVYGFQRALYDGLCMSFLTLLDRPSAVVMEQLITAALFKQTGATAAKLLKGLLKVPPPPSPSHVLFEHFWVERGSTEPSRLSLESRDRYVLTKTICEHLKNLARAVFVQKYPVLLQGPTSSGKTSLVEYLATITQHRFVRINNHEHTDLQEYFGSYVTDSSGKLVFQEGILVEAVRKGYWIVLDELNLAPSDVLEALNRLLDDNRELFVPELQVTVKPHPHFMLFATQNPPGIYGGRKVLSRAFRNRFMELHVDDIPDDELCQILEKRCQIPGSYAGKMVEVMKDLQRHRQSSKVFAGKHGFITPRDLFRWADRHGNGYEELARDGYMLLAERLRNTNEKEIVLQTLEKHMRVKIDIEQLHAIENSESLHAAQECLNSQVSTVSFGKIVWTRSMKRLFNLVVHCIQHSEPVLLVGETGSGKTMICQLLALLSRQRLHILNCHQHSETSDFLGGLRPLRERDHVAVKYQNAITKLVSTALFSKACEGELSSKIEDSATTLGIIRHALSHMRELSHDKNDGSDEEVKVVEILEKELMGLHKDWQSLFIWHDGPLVQAMQNGDFFLVDEISLAEDSVLERLNSVLEPKRLLVLAEKGGSVVEEIIAHPKFRLLATMNPGGDFGKKELSPALRNRFTEIWVPPISDLDDLKSIVVDRFSMPELVMLADPMLQFWQWFQHHHETGRLLSVRDLLAWIMYINVAEADIGKKAAFIHGAFLVLLDGIGFGMGLSSEAAKQLKSKCLEHLFQLLPPDENGLVSTFSFEDWGLGSSVPMNAEGSSSSLLAPRDMFGIHPFYIPKGNKPPVSSSFALAAPTTSRNALRILRAMQLSKPVLLEGSPGVGKTSLVAALAAASSHSLVRINLSEQTDIMDLLGSHLPVEGGTGAEFCWSDGVFLQALKAGNWVLLDELNLASQSVLEGLNACLDHRGELFIPELGCSFKCHSAFRVFACQNPLSQGGGRKGLPKSFLNRFTKVYMDTLSKGDFLFIAKALHPSLTEPLLLKMIEFNAQLYDDTMVTHAYGNSGAPWEFNLRDILRWCELIEGARDGLHVDAPERFLDVIYLQRMRTADDRCCVLTLFQKVFNVPPNVDTHPRVSVSPDRLQIGLASLPRREGLWLQGDMSKQLQLLPGLVNRLEAAMHCVAQGWMCILVGPPATGKTSIVRLLATLTGNPLREFSLSTATDTTELLGCFEQFDLFRCWQEMVRSVYDAVKTLCSFCLALSGDILQADLKLNLVKSLLGSWTAFQKCSATSGNRWVSLEFQPDQSLVNPVAVDMLLQTVEKLVQVAVVCRMPVVNPDLEPHTLLHKVKDFKASMGQQQGKAGQFEWVDGGLLKAVEHGDWVVLENANFCNPTVLDRLNPLLEPGGSIMVNERGLVNGEAMVIRAHPNFRLFLTVDPSHGEVSRAMRNRGVELFMLQPDWFQPETKEMPISEDLVGGTFSGELDSLKVLIQAGVPRPTLLQAMCKAHIGLQTFPEVSSGHIVSLRELWQWVSLLQQLLERGWSLAWSLQCSWEQTYARCLASAEVRRAAMEKFQSQLGLVKLPDVGSWREVGLWVPGGWPNPLTVMDFSLNSKEITVLRDCMFVEFLGVQSFASSMAMEWQSSGENLQQLLKRLQSKAVVAAHFPGSLLYHYLKLGNGKLMEAQKFTVSPWDAAEVHLTLRYACLWMIEQASHSDFELRLQWLEHFSMQLGCCGQVLALLVTTLKRESQHPVRQQLVAAWIKYAGAEMENAHTFKLLRQFPPSSVDTKDLELENSRTNWVQVVCSAKKLQALRHSLLQWEAEDEVFTMSEKLGLGSSSSPIVQSYQQSKHRADKSFVPTSQIPRALLNYLYYLFQFLRQLENEFLSLETGCMWDVTTDSSFLRVQECHESLWRNLSTSKFEVEEFLFCWSSIKQSLRQLISLPGICGPGGVTKKAAKLQDVIRMIDEPFSLGADALAKPLLWKFAGHPELPHSKEVHDQELQVMALCQSWWNPVPDMEMASISADGMVRRLAMTALSIIRWLGQLIASRRTGSPDSTPEVVKSVVTALGLSSEAQMESQEIHRMLQERVEGEKNRLPPHRSYDIVPMVKNFVPESTRNGNCKCILQHGSFPTFPTNFLRWPTAWTLWSELLQWLDHLSLHSDALLLSEVSLLAGNIIGDEEELRASLKMRISAQSVNEMMNFGLSCSLRSPTDFVPHQHLLWILDATQLAEYPVLKPFRDTVHEMWFSWHQALWRNAPGFGDNPTHWSRTAGPPRLFQASQTVHLSSLMGQPGPVRDHRAKLAQLNVASLHAWLAAKRQSNGIFKSNFASASALFQQVIFSHQKSFRSDDVGTVHTALSNFHEGVVKDKQDTFLNSKEDILKTLGEILQHSNHTELLSLVHSLVLPCLEALYFTPWGTLSSSEVLKNLGQVWLLIGEMRLRLLLPVDGCDPVAKYTHKHTHMLRKHSELELEIKVRQESELLVRGSRHTVETQDLRLNLDRMKQELTALSLKLIPRPYPPQFRDFVTEVLRFLKSSVDAGKLAALVRVLCDDMQIRQPSSGYTFQEVATWQDNSAQFISFLSSEFSHYRDVVQPIQLGIYELKLGLSLTLAACLQAATFGKEGISQGESTFMRFLSSLMEFPLARSLQVSQIDVGFGDASSEEFMAQYSSCTQLVNNASEQILSQVVRVQQPSSIPGEVLELELKVMVMRVALLRMGIEIQQDGVKSKGVLGILETIFSSLTLLWSEIRERQNARNKEDEELVRFSSRTHTMETEAQLDEASFRAMFKDFTSEFKGLDNNPAFASAEEDDRRAEAAAKEELVDEGKQRIDKAWLAIQEPLLKDVVVVHKQIFGSKTVLQDCQMLDKERVDAFTLAYDTGRRLIEAVGHSVPAKLDDQVMAANLMRLSLEHRSLGEISQNTKHTIYRDSNPPEMALILDPLAGFVERVGILLEQWPEHPILEQLLNIAKALLSISLEAPVMKAVTGVELLLAKAQLWEENAANHVSIGKEMNELMRLVRRWRKLELEGWPALLESTQRQHEVNAEKLWFFLYGLLHRQRGEDPEADIEATTGSLEEYMQTSTIGEFQKRLDLLLAFHGQFSAKENGTFVQVLANVLYNVWKYYIQFLPAVQEMLSTGRGPIEKELKDFVKLTKWEDFGYYALALSAEKTHRKLHKLIRKYDDLLKRPVIELLMKQSLRMGSQMLTSLSSSQVTEPALVSGQEESEDIKLVSEPLGVPVVGAFEVDEWGQYCREKLAQMTTLISTIPLEFPEVKRLPSLISKMGSFIGAEVFLPSDRRRAQQEGVDALGMLGSAVITRSAELRQGEKRLAVKKKALADLLKVLRQIGLSHHKSSVPKDKRSPKKWFQEPPFDVGVLLGCWTGRKPVGKLETGGDFDKYFGSSLINTSSMVWRQANDYYYNNIALMQRLWQKALDFNKALSLREVEVSTRYMEHLLYLQRKQRRTAYEFTTKLMQLMNLTSLLASFGAGRSPLPQQQASLRWWMWQQKNLLDLLCHASAESVLLFKTSEALQKCPTESSIPCEASSVKAMLATLLTNLEDCKRALDQHLGGGSDIMYSSWEKTWPLLITPIMLKSLSENFIVLKNTQTQFLSISSQNSGNQVPGLRSLQGLLSKGVELSENFEAEMSRECFKIGDQHEFTPFVKQFEMVVSEVLVAVQKLRKTETYVSHDTDRPIEVDFEILGTIQLMDSAITMQMSALHLDQIYASLIRTVSLAVETLDAKVITGSDAPMNIGQLLGCIHIPVEMLQVAGMQILNDYVVLQKTVSKLGYILSNLFNSLYTEGFCVTKEEESGEAGGEKFEDADGTGMGEGEGKKDVSDQIEDEDQLIGTSEKNEDAPTADGAEKKGEKGVEMEQDFDGDMLDLSEDESDEDVDKEEDEGKLESQMGETGDESEIVDEQLWNDNDNENDGGQHDGKEKYEKEAPIAGASSEDLELRAKQEEEDKGGEGKTPQKEEPGKDSESAKAQDIEEEQGVAETDEAGMNQEEAYEDPSGVKPRTEEELELPEDLNLDGQGEEDEDMEADEDMGGGEKDLGGVDAAMECDEQEVMDDDESKGLPDGGGEVEEEHEEKSQEEGPETEQEANVEEEKHDNEGGTKSKEEKRVEGSETVDGSDHHGEGLLNEKAMPEAQDIPAPDFQSDSRAKGGAEASAALFGRSGDQMDIGINEAKQQMGDTEALPDQTTSQLQQSAIENSSGDKSSCVSNPALNSKATPSLDKLEANPYRRLGDALKQWKEMVQLQDASSVPDEDMVPGEELLDGTEEDKGMYEYVQKEEKGGAQALGAATDDQLAESQSQQQRPQDVDMEDTTNDEPLPPSLDKLQLEEEIDDKDMEGVQATQLSTSLKKGRSLDMNQARVEENKEAPLSTTLEESQLEFELEQRTKGHDSIVSLTSLAVGPQVDQQVMNSNSQLDVQSWTEEELRDVRKDLEVKLREGDGTGESARVMWQKFEQLTVRLSQELAEQLRLILEPTLAAKLEGDYRSGKRINMKKIIPYVASQFRKDKIWLRRTKASKRQYQVVLAIDDSRSMSESHCGHIALEALITICRAMSQLEIGQMAVASFGEKGNVRLLHDFDQPFSSEAGLNMVSQFTFRQENTIADEPMVDLLHYLTHMLDFAARHATAPSGQNNLQQLVLILADGRFHEKESLRRCVRDAMNRKQLLAFLVLDNPQESILDMQSVSFSNGAPSFSKYLDAFPFPYYILLRDIEALPRTLADLLRQWFELMQRSVS